jgi:hypothetical protein
MWNILIYKGPPRSMWQQKMNQPQVHPQGKPQPPTTYAPFPPGAPPAPVKTERQWGGYLLAMLIYLVFVFLFVFSLRMAMEIKGDLQTFFILSTVSFLPIVVFFLLIAKDNSEYLVGKPSILKLLPVIIGSLLLIATSIFGLQNADHMILYDHGVLEIICKVSLVLAPIFPVLFYFMYFGDDASGSWTLALKPWAFPAGALVFGQPPTFIHPSQQQIPRV